MKSVKPYSIGIVVIYVCTEADNEAQRGAGNVANILPAMIVNDWPDNEFYQDNGIVNLKVSCDGQGDLWRTSVPHDQDNKAPGTWHWPEMK